MPSERWESCSDCGAPVDAAHAIGCLWDGSGADVPESELEDLEGAGFVWFGGRLVQEVRDAAA